MTLLARLRSWNSWRRARQHRWVSSLKQWLGRPSAAPPAPVRQFQHPFSAELEQRPQGIYWGIDVPAAGAVEIYTTVLVEGWACSERGATAVSFFLDGTLLQEIQPSQSRPDVAAAIPHLTAAATSGFSTTIHLDGVAAGQHVLTLAFQDQQGCCAVDEVTVRVKEFRHPLSATLENRPKGIDWGIDRLVVPHYDTAGIVPIVGWACAQAGIEKISIYLDGEFVQTIQTEHARPDVAEKFPAAADAATSGFSTTIALDDAGAGERMLILAFYDRLGRCAVAELPLNLVENQLHYHRYFLRTLPSTAAAAAMLAELQTQTFALPHFDWWICGDDLEAISSSLHSIVDQQYPEWHCHLLAPAVHSSALQAIIDTIVPSEQRSQVTLQTSMAPTAEPSQAGHHYIGFIQAGEILAPHALVRWATALNSAQPDLSYTDHDQVKPGNLRCQPHFKPDWSPDYALARNYVGGLYLARQGPTLTHVLAEVADLDAAGTWRYDVWLGLTETAHTIQHWPEALWSEPEQTTPASNVVDRELMAVAAALQRRPGAGSVEAIADGTSRRLRWPLPNPLPLVSIIIPTTGRLDLVQPLLESLRSTTAYQPYELIFIDNSRGNNPVGIQYLHQQAVHVIEHAAPFNWSKLNNLGAAAARGELLLFLNDDIEIIDCNWLHELVAQAQRPDIGTVGALLLYPNGCIQHGGIFLVDHGGGVQHSLQFSDPQFPIYQNLHQVAREVAGNTGACLMVRRDVFEQVGGFDEDFVVTGSDIDFALRISCVGYRNLWTPFAKLVHHESISRKRESVGPDEQRFWQRWGQILTVGDSYYNPNLTQQFTDYSLQALPPASTASGVRSAVDARPLTPAGINLIGFIRAEMGLGEAARGLASAIAAANVPFSVIDYVHLNPAQMGDDTWLHKIVEQPEYELNILHMNADLLPHVVESLPASYFKGRYQIGYWAWELPEFPDEWLSAFEYVDEVWVPSQFVQSAVAKKANVPVVCIPHTVEKADTVYLGRAYFELPSSKFLFLMMYDTYSYQERKNPLGAIAAFRQAFPADRPDVGLVIKVNNANDADLSTLHEAIGDSAAIYVLDSIMSRYEVDSLIHTCDCYVSLHRAEGFGLGIAEAMALGRPAIATHWSGNTDFTNPDNAVCIGYELRQIGQDYGPYKADQYWAEPDIAEAAQWMRRLADDPAYARQLGERAQRTVAEQLSAAVIGEQIRQRVFNIHQHQKM